MTKSVDIVDMVKPNDMVANSFRNLISERAD